jgi:hypothetical protein
MSKKQWSSTREISTGSTVDYKCDCKAAVGACIEASIDAKTTNNNVERQQSGIYLGQL